MRQCSGMSPGAVVTVRQTATDGPRRRTHGCRRRVAPHHAARSRDALAHCGKCLSSLGVCWAGRLARHRVYLFRLVGYTASMTKRLVEIDDQLLARARTVAGTDTIKATVETALKSLVDRDTALRHVARLRQPGALDIDRINDARRPRTGTDG